MTQLPLPESSIPVDISSSRRNNASQRAPASPYSSPYQVAGPHSKLRTQLLWVNRLLASDETSSVSGISVRELGEALSRFQKELRVQVLPSEAMVGGSASPSSTRIDRRSRTSLRAKTRNFKN